MDTKVAMKMAEMEALRPYLSDYMARFHVREVARIIGRSHRTASIALSGLEKKGVMKHEDAGKNKHYFINSGSFLAREYIRNAESYRKMLFIQDKKNFIFMKLMAELSPVIGGTPLLLFGSHAKGEATKGSDIDLFILCSEKDSKILANKIKDFAMRHGIDIHRQVFSQNDFKSALEKGDNLAIEVLRNHIILNNEEIFARIFWDYHEKRGN